MSYEVCAKDLLIGTWLSLSCQRIPQKLSEINICHNIICMAVPTTTDNSKGI